jgi:hypothetical protein
MSQTKNVALDKSARKATTGSKSPSATPTSRKPRAVKVSPQLITDAAKEDAHAAIEVNAAVPDPSSMLKARASAAPVSGKPSKPKGVVAKARSAKTPPKTRKSKGQAAGANAQSATPKEV